MLPRCNASNERVGVFGYEKYFQNQKKYPRTIFCLKMLIPGTGTGTTVESVRHCLFSLRRLLSPHFAVNPINSETIITEPWAPTCALLVMPGGADLGYCRVLNGPGNKIISQFVWNGGAYLGLCAGGYYGCGKVEFEVGNGEMEVVGSRELSFFPGTCRGAAFTGFAYASESGARASKLKIEKGTLGHVALEEFRSYYNGGGLFVDAEEYEGIEVLARYTQDLSVTGGDAAVVYCKVGSGGAVLTGPHPEYVYCIKNRVMKVLTGRDSLVSIWIKVLARKDMQT